MFQSEASITFKIVRSGRDEFFRGRVRGDHEYCLGGCVNPGAFQCDLQCRLGLRAQPDSVTAG